jgi:predicted Zn-dependent protease
MKDESSSVPIVECVCLRAKMYAFKTDYKSKAVAKGIKRSQIKKLQIENYKAALFGATREEIQQTVTANFIRQNNHIVNSIRISKIGLSALDDKRFVCRDNINSLAHGHYKIQELE